VSTPAPTAKKRIRSLNSDRSNANYTELALLKLERDKLKKRIQHLETDLQNEKKEKEHLQVAFQRTTRSMRNSQSLLNQLQKETLQSSSKPRPPKISPRQSKDIKNKQLRQKIEAPEVENEELKRLMALGTTIK